MPLIRCSCGKNLKVAAEMVGRKLRCPHCGQIQQATVNGTRIINWSGNEADLSIDGRFWPLPNDERRLWVGSWLTTYRITRCDLTMLSP